ncbi:hypothetical protein ANN_19780 [Periplaneta americana]|uniref:DUF4371 domain-containing protein n=1 Tax=Periplaneta americana TaxID=6978 RepID=A0ABQ8SB75_PERAM|nr:hypothetical protein ANN_19780 [Periplaneta americana]
METSDTISTSFSSSRTVNKFTASDIIQQAKWRLFSPGRAAAASVLSRRGTAARLNLLCGRRKRLTQHRNHFPNIPLSILSNIHCANTIIKEDDILMMEDTATEDAVHHQLLKSQMILQHRMWTKRDIVKNMAEQVSGEVCVENDCVIEGLLKVPFNRRTYNEKVEIVKMERPTPELNLSMDVKEKQREYTRHFTSTSYGKQELAFRGHNESVESDNRGNYIEYLSSLSEFDHLLANHLESSTVFRGTSLAIQNDLIFAISGVMIKNIKSEIEEAPFVAIVVDETSDCSNQSQLSTVLRYVDSTANVQERFIGFTNVSSGKTAAALFQHVEGVIAEYNVGNKLIAQTYDGALVMAGNINGLKTKVQEKYPQALFVHCYSHVLNLVLQQTTLSIPECRIFSKHCRV